MLSHSVRNRSDVIVGAPPVGDPGKARFDEFFRSAGVPVRYSRGVEIYGECEPSKYCYKVVTGAVRTYRVLTDGRRHVVAFAMPDDFVGIEANGIHSHSAEAVSSSELLVVSQSQLMLAAEKDVELALHLWTITDRTLRRTQAHSLLLIKTAKERVSAFLEEMAGHGCNGCELDIVMSRQDIADHLGLTVETVSRTLADLEHRGAISVPNARRIILCDRRALTVE